MFGDKAIIRIDVLRTYKAINSRAKNIYKLWSRLQMAQANATIIQAKGTVYNPIDGD
jgi:hypothetical protein